MPHAADSSPSVQSPARTFSPRSTASCSMPAPLKAGRSSSVFAAASSAIGFPSGTTGLRCGREHGGDVELSRAQVGHPGAHLLLVVVRRVEHDTDGVGAVPLGLWP